MALGSQRRTRTRNRAQVIGRRWPRRRSARYQSRRTWLRKAFRLTCSASSRGPARAVSESNPARRGALYSYNRQIQAEGATVRFNPQQCDDHEHTCVSRSQTADSEPTNVDHAAPTTSGNSPRHVAAGSSDAADIVSGLGAVQHWRDRRRRQGRLGWRAAWRLRYRDASSERPYVGTNH